MNNNIYKIPLLEENIKFENTYNFISFYNFTKRYYFKLFQLLELKNELLYIINVENNNSTYIKIKLKEINKQIKNYVSLYNLPEYILVFSFDDKFYEFGTSREINVDNIDNLSIYEIKKMPKNFDFEEYMDKVSNYFDYINKNIIYLNKKRKI